MRKKLFEIKILADGLSLCFSVPSYVTEDFFESLPDDHKIDFIKKREQKIFERVLGKDWKTDWKNKIFFEGRYHLIPDGDS